jgi:methylthioribose-1-phosphate isomerase
VDTRSAASSGTDDPGPEPAGSSAGADPELAGAPGQEAVAGPPAQGGDAGAGAAPQAATPPATATSDHDPSRRAFFRAFGRQAVTTVGQVAGMADMLGLGPASAAANLLSLGLGVPGQQSRPAPGTAAARRPYRAPAGSYQAPTQDGVVSADTYRSPYRLEGDVLRILDQRALPDRIEELTCRRGSDVAYYLRVGAVRGGPIMAQLAAYALAMSASSVADRPRDTRRSEATRIARSLRAARPSSRLLTWAIERMAEVADAQPESLEGPGLAAALRAEADAIASHMQLDQAAIARTIMEIMPVPDGRPLSVLVHGAPGSLSGGLAGTALSAIAQLAGEGRDLLVRVTETRPFLEGARLAAWELRNAGVAHQVIPDAAVAWLLASEPVDAILLGAEWVAANGDLSAVVGSRALGLQAAGGGADGSPVPLVVAALVATIDPGTPDGEAIPGEMRPGRELASYVNGVSSDRSNALNPAVDVVPARLVGALVTERGVLSPVDEPGVGALLAGAGRASG